jgi:hypothetical protein
MMAEVFSGLGVPDWWRSDTGLILPSSVRDLHVQPTPDGGEVRFEGLLTAERHRPLGNVGVYATPAAMQVAPLPLEEFIADLAAIPLGMVLSVVSWIQATLHGKEMTGRCSWGSRPASFKARRAFHRSSAS